MTAPAVHSTDCPQCPHLHTPEETSTLLGGRPSARTLRNKAAAGEIAHTRPAGLSRAIRFSDDDIAQIIRDGTQGRPVRRVRHDSRRHS